MQQANSCLLDSINLTLACGTVAILGVHSIFAYTNDMTIATSLNLLTFADDKTVR
jgi:hypothetical protein